MRIRQTTLFLFVCLCLTSCEGFKVLTLHNSSDKDIIITTNPGLPEYDKNKIGDYPDTSAHGSSTVILKPDSSIVVSEIFTGLVFNKQIKEQDLRINYLKIQTATDTIEAKNKTEIIQLLNNEKTKYNPTTDTAQALIGSKNYGNIIIR